MDYAAVEFSAGSIAGCDRVRIAPDGGTGGVVTPRDVAANPDGMMPPEKPVLPTAYAASDSAIGVHMEIRTSRFGVVAVDDQRVITFPRGLLGFPDYRRFALIQTGQGNYFFWLQSVDDPNIAFVVTDPSTFFKDYDVAMRDETLGDLAFSDLKFAQVFVICNKVGEWLTGNLLGPIILNSENFLAQQVVLTEKKWTTRQPLLRLASEAPLAKSA